MDRPEFVESDDPRVIANHDQGKAWAIDMIKSGKDFVIVIPKQEKAFTTLAVGDAIAALFGAGTMLLHESRLAAIEAFFEQWQERDDE